MSRVRIVLIFFILCLAVYMGSHAVIEPSQPSSPSKADLVKEETPSFSRSGDTLSTSSASAPGSSPTAGHLSPSPPKWASLKRHMNWDSSGLEVINHPDGRKSIRAGGRFTQMAAGVRDASGRMVIHCFADYTAMDDALSGTPIQAPLSTTSEDKTYEISDF